MVHGRSSPRRTPAQATLPASSSRAPRADAFVLDPRLEQIQGSRYRNDIEVFEFDPSRPSFGIGHGRIIGVELTAVNGRALNYVVGGETVVLTVQAEAVQPLASPIIGFLVRDRLGQLLFGDNTYLTTAGRPARGERLRAICRPLRVPDADPAGG